MGGRWRWSANRCLIIHAASNPGEALVYLFENQEMLEEMFPVDDDDIFDEGEEFTEHDFLEQLASEMGHEVSEEDIARLRNEFRDRADDDWGDMLDNSWSDHEIPKNTQSIHSKISKLETVLSSEGSGRGFALQPQTGESTSAEPRSREDVVTASFAGNLGGGPLSFGRSQYGYGGYNSGYASGFTSGGIAPRKGGFGIKKTENQGPTKRATSNKWNDDFSRMDTIHN
eukprot:TRINITY_DN1029_c0_g1_i1.p1 TRINITY_DN1029_c0_g1~~TRINITY_DN1029_c0_g1_i1.p1  ORF type:complete len:228 (+),score=66.84 TRINITY_DN1029_c0_g1_i1:54-737(+)